MPPSLVSKWGAAYEIWQGLSQAVQSTTRRSARQYALLSLLGHLVDIDIELLAEDLDRATAGPTPVSSASDAIANPKGLLLEIAQRQQAEAPTFEFSEEAPAHLRQYRCVAAIELQGQHYRSGPQAVLSKKEAERADAPALLAQLPVELVENRPKGLRALQITPDKSPISLLQEWTSQRLYKQPQYVLERSGRFCRNLGGKSGYG